MIADDRAFRESHQEGAPWSSRSAIRPDPTPPQFGDVVRDEIEVWLGLAHMRLTQMRAFCMTSPYAVAAFWVLVAVATIIVSNVWLMRRDETGMTR